MAAEKNFENKIKDYLDEQGAWHVKFFANRMTKRGIPDLLTCINGYFVGIEVKAEGGRESDLQRRNISKIRKAKGFAIVLYPHQFDDFKMFVRELYQGNIARAINYMNDIYKG